MTLPIAHEHLAAFHPGDRIFLRDPRGRSLSPSILLSLRADGLSLSARSRFLIHYSYTVTRDDGVRFVEVTGDPNEIHRKGDIVAGALTASKMILPLEVLFPKLRLTAARVKFVSFSRYHRRTSSRFLCHCVDGDQVRFEAQADQDGSTVAIGTIDGVIDGGTAQPEAVKERRVNRDKLAEVTAFLESVGVESEAYFEKGTYRDYTYPLAYVASLPSGVLVEQMDGQGGMLNVIRFDFKDQPKIPIIGKHGPAVQVERGRVRSRFHRIITNIIDGMITHYRGSAVVHPGS